MVFLRQQNKQEGRGLHCKDILTLRKKAYALLMISINVRSGSVKSLKESYYQAALRWVGTCLICQRPFWRHGSYPRVTPRLLGPLPIQRVYCKHCGVTHALLPCFIIPFARVLDVVREAAIMSICHNLHTIEELAEFLAVEPSTIARWWRIFRTKSGVMLQALSAMLAQTPQPADWARGNFDTWRERGSKILELIGRCRATFYPRFMFCGFAWVNLLNPHLLFTQKNARQTFRQHQDRVICHNLFFRCNTVKHRESAATTPGAPAVTRSNPFTHQRPALLLARTNINCYGSINSGDR